MALHPAPPLRPLLDRAFAEPYPIAYRFPTRELDLVPVYLLVPPYRRLSRSVDGPPPLGAVALAAADSAEPVSGFLKPLLQWAPWCVPCLLTGAETATPGVLTAIHELPGHPAFVPGPVTDQALTTDVVAAVRTRPVPGGARLADYVVRRTERPDLRFELAWLLDPETGEFGQPVPERTIRDRLKRFGPLGVHGWRGVGVLCRLAVRPPRRSVARMAKDAGVGARTLRSWVRRYLGVTMVDYRSRLGWEWVLEAALRVGRYVALPETRRIHPATTRSGRSAVTLTSATELPRSQVPGRTASALVTEIARIEPEIRAPAS